jgi:xanthine dehydrogenase accessory factor
VIVGTDIKGLDPGTSPAVIVATQGIWDEEALAAALARDASYVGLVASPTRATVVRAWLRDEAGVPEERLAALRAPAGLDLGAETAEEVALSILAELVQVRRGTAAFVASPGPATMVGAGAAGAGAPGSAAGSAADRAIEPIVDDIVLLDPVCGMTVDRAHARHLAEHDGIVYAFCSMGCRTSFIREPTAYLPASV